MNDHELWETVNPVFNTAKSCVQLDAAAGDEDAQKLLDVLGFGPFAAKVTSSLVPPEIVEKVKRLFPAYMVLTSSRFQTMNNLIECREDRQIVDLPCGYTSRGIRLARQNRRYYGFDLPAVIDAVKPAAMGIIGKNDGITYHAVDATNYDSLAAAFTPDSHDLMVTTEGLLMYFSQSELEEVFSNIHRLLQQYGGSWVITDRAFFLHDREVVDGALNHDPGLIAMYTAVTSRSAAATADVRFNDNVFFDPDDEKVRAFIREQGFELHEICMGDYLPEQLTALNGDRAAEASVREAFGKMMFWELSVARKKDQPASIDPNLPFKAECEVRDGAFCASIQGRMDTITAPELLKQFQAAGDGIEAIHVDVSRMSYVSSAGLRVLLMMYKSLADKDRFELTGISDGVREILETTGFDQFLLKD